MAKIRKNKISYNSKELTAFADKANSEDYRYECFRIYIYAGLKTAAQEGMYKASINVSGYSDKYIDKIMDELLRNNMTCNAYSISNNNYYNLPGYRSVAYDSPSIKTLEVCWNTFKAYSQTLAK